MKKKKLRDFFIILILFSILNTSCDDKIDNLNEENNNTTTNALTQIINLEQYPVNVYSDSLRNHIIAEIAANGSTTVNALVNRGGSAYYPTFYLDFLEIPEIAISYNAPPVVFVIEADKTNQVTVPKLEFIETGFAYIKIENKSNFQLTLNHNNNEKIPLGNISGIIQSNSIAAYEIIPDLITNYTILQNSSLTIDFPMQINEFKRGIIYIFECDNNELKLKEEKSVLEFIPPVTPTNVKAEMLSTDSVKISWNGVYGATMYKIYRAMGYINAQYELISSTKNIFYDDSNLLEGQAYYYKVSAVSRSPNESKQTVAVSAYTPPGDIRVIDKSTMSITLEWNSINEATGYNIYRSDSSNGIYNKINFSLINQTEYTDNNLTPGTTYFYRVNAIVNGIESIQSNQITATTVSPIPDGLRLISRSTVSILLGWNPVKGSSGYNIYRSDSIDGTFLKINENTVFATEYIDTGLIPETTYYYRITSIINNEEGLQSNIFAAFTLSSVPENIKSNNSTTISISIEWDYLNGASGYNIYRSENENGVYTKINQNIISENKYIDNGLLADKDYFYKISSINNGIEGTLSSSISASTISSIPNNIRLNNKTTVAISLVWDYVNGASGYNVYKSENLNGIYNKINAQIITENSFTDTGLLPDTGYYYKLSSINNDIEGIISEPIYITTLTAIPNNIYSYTVSTNSIKISWDSVNQASGYNIYRSTSQNGIYIIINTSAITDNNYTDTSLTEYTIYYYRVSSIIENSESQQSNFVIANTGILAQGSTLAEKLTWLQSNAISNNLYGLAITANENLSPQSLLYSNRTNIRLVLSGSGSMRTITLATRGALFSIGAGVTLILDNNITLNGRVENNTPVINVNEDGTLIMNNGSQITGNSNISLRAGGVSVLYGTFIMNGGKIFNNTSIDDGGGVHVAAGSFIMNNGEISENTGDRGGGVFVRTNGVFTLNNGLITKNTSTADNAPWSSLAGGGVCSTGVFYMKGGEISGNNAVVNLGGGVAISNSFFMSGGVIYGNNASSSLRNTAVNGCAAVFGYVQYGTYNGDVFTRTGFINEVETTIRIVNGNIQTN